MDSSVSVSQYCWGSSRHTDTQNPSSLSEAFLLKGISDDEFNEESDRSAEFPDPFARGSLVIGMKHAEGVLR